MKLFKVYEIDQSEESLRVDIPVHIQPVWAIAALASHMLDGSPGSNDARWHREESVSQTNISLLGFAVRPREVKQNCEAGQRRDTSLKPLAHIAYNSHPSLQNEDSQKPAGCR